MITERVNGRSATYSSGYNQPVGNALRFTDEGQIVLRSRTDGSNGWSKWKTAAAVLIPRNWQNLPAICAGKRQTRRHRAGTAISSRLAQAMGGELSATSTPRLEAVFVYACRYVLPRHPCQNSQSGGAS